jgi:cell division protein FtsB
MSSWQSPACSPSINHPAIIGNSPREAADPVVYSSVPEDTPKIKIMRFLKYAFPLWVGIVVYSVAAVTVGKTGLQSYEGLLREQEKQRQNLSKLHTINDDLNGVRDALQYDNDTIAVYARDLGYGSEKERFVKIAGLDSARPHRISEGEMLPLEIPGFVDDKTLRLIAICVSGGLFFALIFIDLLRLFFRGR